VCKCVLVYSMGLSTCFHAGCCESLQLSADVVNDAVSISLRCVCSAMVEQPSPYMQKLANSHVVPMNGSTRRRRPTSAASTGRPMSAGVGGANKPRVDERFIADPDLYDPATPHDSYQQKRPTSAPVYKRSPDDDIIDDDDNYNCSCEL